MLNGFNIVWWKMVNGKEENFSHEWLPDHRAWDRALFCYNKRLLDLRTCQSQPIYNSSQVTLQGNYSCIHNLGPLIHLAGKLERFYTWFSAGQP